MGHSKPACLSGGLKPSLVSNSLLIWLLPYMRFSPTHLNCVWRFSYSLCYLTRFEPWTETCSHPQHIFPSLLHHTFCRCPLLPSNVSPLNGQEKPWFSLLWGRTFPEHSETIGWTRVSYSNKNLEMKLSLISFSFLKDSFLLIKAMPIKQHFFCYKKSPKSVLHLSIWPVTDLHMLLTASYRWFHFWLLTE